MLIYFRYNDDYYEPEPFPLIVNFTFQDDIFDSIEKYKEMRNGDFPCNVIRNWLKKRNFDINIKLDVYHIIKKRLYRKIFGLCFNDFPENTILEFYDEFCNIIDNYFSIYNEDKQRGCLSLLHFIYDRCYSKMDRFLYDELGFAWKGKFVRRLSC